MRRKALCSQQGDTQRWKTKVQALMRGVGEAVLSGTKPRFGEYPFYRNTRVRDVDVWRETLLWKVLNFYYLW